MRFGVREICDVVLKAKAAQKVGDKIFYKNEPVLYFDSLKTSSMEGTATTVYANGGRGNARLIAWEGERTVTFTMEDALLSPASFMILSGAGLINASEKSPIYVHTTEITDAVSVAAGNTKVEIQLNNMPYWTTNEDLIYVMLYDGNEVTTEPYIVRQAPEKKKPTDSTDPNAEEVPIITLEKAEGKNPQDDLDKFSNKCSVLVDYYVEQTTDTVQQIDITPEKFGGNYYLEASTLFRNTDGVDMPAEFIIPNCKIQSNFTFTMAATGDPSTFTFTLDAFPDYTRFNKTQKVLAAIQIIQTGSTIDTKRTQTKHAEADEGQIF